MTAPEGYAKPRAITTHPGVAEHLRKAVAAARPREGWTVRIVKLDDKDVIYLEHHGTFVKDFISVGGLQAWLKFKGMTLADVKMKEDKPKLENPGCWLTPGAFENEIR